MLILFILFFTPSLFANTECERINNIFNYTQKSNLRNFNILNARLSCGVLESHGKEPMEFRGDVYSPFWAQEYTGVDLVKEEMAKTSWLNNRVTKVAIFDLGFYRDDLNLSKSEELFTSVKYRGSHGTHSANVLNGVGPYGGGSYVSYTAITSALKPERKRAIIEYLESVGQLPKVISDSTVDELQYMEKGQISLSQDLEQKQIFWIKSAGNNLRNISNLYPGSKQIFVGGISPDGNITPFDYGSNVAIYTPTYRGLNDGIASIGENGVHEYAGGTSAAAPFTAGVISNVTTMIPDLTSEELRKLLDYTSLPTLGKKLKLKDQSKGMLNAYKFFKVGKIIAERCGYDKKVKGNIKCKEELIENLQALENNSEISKEVSKALVEADKIFPYCNDSNKDVKLSEFSCQKSKEITKTLRRLSLLDSDNSKVWRFLSCIAKVHGYNGNAKYFTNMAKLVDDPVKYGQRLEKELLQKLINVTSDGEYKIADLPYHQVLQVKGPLHNELKQKLFEMNNTFFHRHLDTIDYDKELYLNLLNQSIERNDYILSVLKKAVPKNLSSVDIKRVLDFYRGKENRSLNSLGIRDFDLLANLLPNKEAEKFLQGLLDNNNLNHKIKDLILSRIMFRQRNFTGLVSKDFERNYEDRINHPDKGIASTVNQYYGYKESIPRDQWKKVYELFNRNDVGYRFIAISSLSKSGDRSDKFFMILTDILENTEVDYRQFEKDESLYALIGFKDGKHKEKVKEIFQKYLEISNSPESLRSSEQQFLYETARVLNLRYKIVD